MAATNTTPSVDSASADEATAKAVHKRYEGLVMVRNKAIKVDPSRFVSGLLPQQPHLMLSGGKEDLGALAMLEDSVKKLKSPKTSPGPTLSKNSDKFKAKALRNLENQNHWMVNLSCQYQGFNSLIKDFTKELPLFRTVTENCLKLAIFVNYKSQLVLLDESLRWYPWRIRNAREVGDMIRDVGFWNDLEAVHMLVKLVKDMAQEIETERPLVGQCLLLWDELRAKVKDWCSKFHIAEGGEIVEKLIERRFKKNYHPAWAAAYILDPLYLVRDTSGKLVSRDEAHIALMELMKWRTQGLIQFYAQAVQMKERDSSYWEDEDCQSTKTALDKVQKLIFIAAVIVHLERRDVFQ
ncbi:Ribonuclease H-like superfamily [Sesbania bispinosa]|nr:Ribonuclease H-like superfamily [Sesbania bispinosa]